jgi:MFS family permease
MIEPKQLKPRTHAAMTLHNNPQNPDGNRKPTDFDIGGNRSGDEEAAARGGQPHVNEGVYKVTVRSRLDESDAVFAPTRALMNKLIQRRSWRGLSRNVFALGWVSFLTDIASEMLYPIIPLFVTGVLGSSPALLGLIEGIAEGGSSLIRWFAGAVSDRFRRRKPFVVAGYTLSAISKPVMGLAAYWLGWPVFLVGRVSDRIGKSIRTSARDALISDSTDSDHRGLAFGVHRAMDTLGAVIGPLVALAIITFKPGFSLAWLFFIALVPGLSSSLLCILLVRDIPHAAHADAKPPPILQHYPRPFWHVIAAAALFSLGNSSDSFLILRSRELGLTFGHVILAFTLYNIVYSLAAIPLGRLSDLIGRKPVVAAGWLVYAGVYFGFSIARTSLAPWVLLTSYGLYQALTEGVTKALVSDVVSKDQRAGAIGLFYTVAGIGQLAASLIAGTIWSKTIGGLHAPFLFGAICALAAVPLILSSGGRGNLSSQLD